MASALPKVLLLGNSHLSAAKFAYDDLEKELNFDAEFFCARGADLFFTEFCESRIKALPANKISSEQLYYFYGKDQNYPEHYWANNAPMEDVSAQFLSTGGRAEIEIYEKSAIFYVSGLSPYDFVRIGKDFLLSSMESQCQYLENLLDKQFFMRDQVRLMRSRFPDVKHYLIGRPLAAQSGSDAEDFLPDTVSVLRETVRSVAGNFLFDDVFMPSAALLTGSLAATRIEYSVGGVRESLTFQGVGASTIERHSTCDTSHMNRSYGRILLQEFVQPIVEAL